MLTSDLQLEYATEKSDFPLINSVKLVILGSRNEEGEPVLLERESPETWKQSSLVEL